MIQTPLDFLEILFDKQKITDCEISHYKYVPQSFEDSRIIKKIKTENIRNYVNTTNLESHEELAIHSRINKSGGEYHIPMIDFDTNNKENIKKIKPLLNKFNIKSGIIFSSGNSFHMYGDSLLCGREQWIKFMGTALRDYSYKTHIIDCRWIGHRLISGYSSLRISNNSGKYKKKPEYEFEII